MTQIRSIAFMICLLVTASMSGSSERYNDALIDRYRQEFVAKRLPSADDEIPMGNQTRQRSGEWREFGMGRFCDGYLTHAYDQEFCEADPPDEWDSFAFDGETYFVQRLTEFGRN